MGWLNPKNGPLDHSLSGLTFKRIQNKSINNWHSFIKEGPRQSVIGTTGLANVSHKLYSAGRAICIV